MANDSKKINPGIAHAVMKDAKLNNKIKRIERGGECHNVRLGVQADIAWSMGIQPAQLNRWIQGKDNITDPNLKELAELWDVYPGYLTGEITIKNAEDNAKKAKQGLENESARFDALKTYLRLSGYIHEETPQPLKENDTIVGYTIPIKVKDTILTNAQFIEYEKAIDSAIEAVSTVFSCAYRTPKVQ